ncbi:MAG: radical SAM protein [Candidatus Omnitrophica bacterium]|nr:radical SAM protein [Candidatus Omnitrophota bacterium]
MELSIEKKLFNLGKLSRFDVTGMVRLFGLKPYLKDAPFIYPAVGFKGNCINLFKVLQTNLCRYNCFYCSNRQSRKCLRLSFSPYELASLFLHFYKKGWVDGLFLSSAIYPEPNKAQENMYITLNIIRKAGFKGYIHTVILPGVEDYLIKKVAQLSDRLSLNLETVDERYLSKLSPDKKFKNELLEGLKKLSFLNREKPLKGGITTQLVVGVAGETDEETLSLADKLYKRLFIDRVYYSGFTPVKDTPLEGKPACSSLREARLYQADFLLRRYGFKLEELVFDKEGNLYKELDPKLVWAKKHPENFPVEINTAEKEKLLRVPGIGLISCERIIKIRKGKRFRVLEDLRKLGVIVSKARNFITLNGRFYPALKKEVVPLSKEKQLFLWEEL